MPRFHSHLQGDVLHRPRIKNDNFSGNADGRPRSMAEYLFLRLKCGSEGGPWALETERSCRATLAVGTHDPSLATRCVTLSVCVPLDGSEALSRGWSKCQVPGPRWRESSEFDKKLVPSLVQFENGRRCRRTKRRSLHLGRTFAIEPDSRHHRWHAFSAAHCQRHLLLDRRLQISKEVSYLTI